MKRTLIIIASLALSLSVHAQSKSVQALYQQFKGNEDFFHMELGGNFMNFADGLKIDLSEDDMETVAKSIERLNFFKLPEGVDQTKGYSKSLRKGLEKEKYDLLLETSEGSSSIHIFSKGSRTISDLVVLIRDNDGDLIVAEMKGEFAQDVVEKAMAQKQ